MAINLPKRIKITDQTGPSCKFQFTVKWVVNLYFYIELKQKSGCPIHTSHPRLIDPKNVPLPTRLLTSDQIDNIVHVVNATSNNGTACNYLHAKSGHFINLMKKSAYLCRKNNGADLSARDDILVMMDNLMTSRDISFVSLSDVPSKVYFLTSTKN